MDAPVPGELPVVVVGGVQRLVRVLDIVGRGRGEQDDVVRTVRRAPLEGFERPAKVAELFGFAPRQQAVPVQRCHPELLDGRSVLVRQLAERIVAELADAKIHEVMRVVFPARRSPEVGIDRSCDDLVAIFREERFQFSRQQVDRAIRDQTMGDITPGRRRRRHGKCDDARAGEHSCFSHLGILRRRTGLGPDAAGVLGTDAVACSALSLQRAGN